MGGVWAGSAGSAAPGCGHPSTQPAACPGRGLSSAVTWLAAVWGWGPDSRPWRAGGGLGGARSALGRVTPRFSMMIQDAWREVPVVGLGTKLASGWGLPGHPVTATTSRPCCCSPRRTGGAGAGTLLDTDTLCLTRFPRSGSSLPWPAFN